MDEIEWNVVIVWQLLSKNYCTNFKNPWTPHRKQINREINRSWWYKIHYNYRKSCFGLICLCFFRRISNVKQTYLEICMLSTESLLKLKCWVVENMSKCLAMNYRSFERSDNATFSMCKNCEHQPKLSSNWWSEPKKVNCNWSRLPHIIQKRFRDDTLMHCS